MKANETFNSKRKREQAEIEEMVNKCDEELDKLRFIELKKNIVGEFIALGQCKTDLQKALLVENLKKQVRIPSDAKNGLKITNSP
jgi:predicted RNA-binding protein